MEKINQLIKDAEQGNADAWAEIGLMYYNGDGVEQDYPKAIEYFIKGADVGSSGSQHVLATAYYYGEVTERDVGKAFYYAEEAAFAGHMDAVGLLARIYENDRTMRSPYYYSDEYSGCSEEEKSSCLRLVDEIIKISGIVRDGGLLMMENYTPETDETIMQIGLKLLVDAAEPKTVETILETYIASTDRTVAEFMRQAIIMQGLLAIQAGEATAAIKDKLYDILGEESP